VRRQRPRHAPPHQVTTASVAHRPDGRRVRAVLRAASDLVAGVTPPAADARPGGPARPLGRPAV
jgi:hypothetical protein